MVRFAVPLALFAAWWAATASGRVKSYQLASPHDVLREVVDLAQSGLLWRDLGASVERVAAGFAIALALALIVGSLVGGSRVAERALDPTLQAIRAVPSLAWVPLILLWLGIGEAAKITLVAIGAFFPVYVALVSGIRGVDRKLVEVGTIFGLSRAALIVRVLVPATLPQLLVGARIGLTQAWLFLVAAELLAATNGLGFLLTDGQQTSRTDEIFVAILLFAVCGKLSETAMRALEKRLAGWTDTVPV
ncbi:MAG TPA: ABC transporter permease [Candidatus Elarobacter sp.]|nr:ABC transporter permease [Candidatus Elarobacter sp.]